MTHDAAFSREEDRRIDEPGSVGPCAQCQGRHDELWKCDRCHRDFCDDHCMEDEGCEIMCAACRVSPPTPQRSRNRRAAP